MSSETTTLDGLWKTLGRIWRAVFEDYEKMKSLQPTKKEIDACARSNGSDQGTSASISS